MNHWQVEIMAEIHRRAIEQEAQDLRLERQALSSQAYRPGWFTRAMFNLANWMITTGKQLRRRYEAPVMDCGHRTTRSYAR